MDIDKAELIRSFLVAKVLIPFVYYSAVGIIIFFICDNLNMDISFTKSVIVGFLIETLMRLYGFARGIRKSVELTYRKNK